MASGDIYVARESFATTLDGENLSVKRGITRVRDGHPLLKANPNRFEPLEVHYDVERTTAAPGEKRGGKRKADDKEPGEKRVGKDGSDS